MKKKILFINPFLVEGGVERALVRLLGSLDSEKYDITLYLYRRGDTLLPLVPDYVNVIFEDEQDSKTAVPGTSLNVLTKLYEAGKKHGEAVKVQEKLAEKRRQFVIDRAAKRFESGFDTVISYSLHLSARIAAAIPAEKHYLFMHSSDPMYQRENAEKSMHAFDKIFCVSEGVKAVLAPGYPEFSEKFDTLCNFVDFDEIKKKAQAEKIEKEDTVTLCSVGRLSYEKGYDIALECAKILQDRGTDFVWNIVAEGRERPNLEKYIADNGLTAVKLLGRRDNPFPYIAACDIFVQPSREEAQPLTVLEAMTLGRPVVSTRTVGGNFILQGGKKGILTDITPEALADGIEELIRDEDKRKKFENLYTREENEKEKAEFFRKWNEVLEGKA